MKALLNRALLGALTLAGLACPPALAHALHGAANSADQQGVSPETWLPVSDVMRRTGASTEQGDLSG